VGLVALASRAELEGRLDHALMYYRRAADMGDPVGLNSMGRFLEFGLAVKKDTDAAYERCARNAHASCTRGVPCIGCVLYAVYLFEVALPRGSV
jgi:TPR repeat protein